MPEEPSVYKYVHDYNYYADLYDQFTIEECRDLEKRLISHKDDEDSTGKLSPKEMKAVSDLLAHSGIYYLTGERYANKDKVIKEWIERDQKKDKKLENARIIEGVRCLICGTFLRCISKDLAGEDEREYVQFVYQCPSHCKGGARIFNESGIEEKVERKLCPKCHLILEGARTRQEKKVEIIYTCPRCKYEKQETLDFTLEEKPADSNYIADRQRFCLGEGEGRQYVDQKMNSDRLTALSEQRERDKKAQEILEQIEKVPIGELQKKLSELLLKDSYENFSLGPPEIRKDLIVEFSVVDTKSGRSESDSRHVLKKILRGALFGTNWKLVSEGVTYRMGFLTARLRCLEREDDLLKQIEKNKLSK